MYIFLKKTCSFENDSRKNDWEKGGSVIYIASIAMADSFLIESVMMSGETEPKAAPIITISSRMMLSSNNGHMRAFPMQNRILKS